VSRAIADDRRVFAGHFVAGIEQAQGVIGALDKGAQANKAEGIVAHDSAVSGAPKQMGALLDPLTKPAHAVMAQALLGDIAYVQPSGIDVFPHVGGDSPTYSVSAGPRRTQTAVDARRVGRVQGKKVQQAFSVQGAMARVVIVQGAGDQQRHGQLVQAIAAPVLGHQRQRIADIEHAREVFGTLQVARHPVQIRGSSTQHGISPRPPRCLWFRRPGTS